MEWPIRSISFSSDSELLAVAGEDDRIDVINIQSGETEYKIDTKSPTNSLSWHPHKRILAYCSDMRDHGVFVKSFEQSGK